MLKLKLIIAFLVITFLCGLSGYLGSVLFLNTDGSFFNLMVTLVGSTYVSFWIAIKSKFIYQLIEDDHLIKYGKDE